MELISDLVGDCGRDENVIEAMEKDVAGNDELEAVQLVRVDTIRAGMEVVKRHGKIVVHILGVFPTVQVNLHGVEVAETVVRASGKLKEGLAVALSDDHNVVRILGFACSSLDCPWSGERDLLCCLLH